MQDTTPLANTRRPERSKPYGAVAAGREILELVADRLLEQVVEERDGERGVGSLDPVQPEAFALAGHLARLEAADAALVWGGSQGELEWLLARSYTALACGELAAWLHTHERRQPPVGFGSFVQETLTTANQAALGERVLAEGCGALGLSDEHTALRASLARFAEEHIGPLAETLHRRDQLVPESVLQGLAELGVFGVSIPERYGGCFSDHTAIIVATEALSQVSLGAGGSVITRPEICAKALLAGGSEEQRSRFLPGIASGERMVSVAVTEPDAGSDVASVQLRARPVEGGYLLTGEKTWCTFAGRADLLVLLARTSEGGHRGLSLFLAEKPPTPAGEGDEYAFTHQDARGGTMEGRAIPTVGYRGMHSFAVKLEDWFVPAENRIGAEGEGFYLTMKGFVGGRIQTAARAVGLMQAALQAACDYAGQRMVFGRRLGELTLTRVKLAEMAARVQAGRQLAYRVGALLDAGQGEREASLVKLLVCRDAERVTREAMQLHGGMGYSEEYAVSRYWLDARVLSIFEGAEEVLALRVIARAYLRERLAEGSV